MAFAIRLLRFYSRIHSGSGIATFSTLRPPVTRISIVRSTQKYAFSTEPTRPKITGSLTNIQSTTTPIEAKLPTVQNKNDGKDDSGQKDDEKKDNTYTPFMKFCMAFCGVSMGVMGTYLLYEMAKPGYDEEGKIIEDEFTHLPYFEQMFKRLLRELHYYKRLVQEPSRDKLLPDPLKYPYIQPQYTLVLELIDLLIHPDWTYQTGWRFKKRPGVDQFLEAIAPPQFEIVVFTAEQGMTVFPIIDALDPQGYVMYRLVRDATRFVDGHHVKDLNALNRDLSKVIVVDWNGDNVKYHPENVLKIPRWNGNDDDTALYDLAAFLKTIHVSQVEDVRDVLNHYKQFENPLEAFRENRRKYLMQLEEDEMKSQKDGTKDLTTKWTPYFLRNR